MKSKLVLFQASFGDERARVGDIHSPQQQAFACEVARELGRRLVEDGFGIILNSGSGLDAELGQAAVQACTALHINPRTRIRTYPYGTTSMNGFGMIMEPVDKRWQEIRTFVVSESDAVVAIAGGKGTSDAIQKAALARKPVFPIATIPGAAKDEWRRLIRQDYCNHVAGDLDFLGDIGIKATELADAIVADCKRLLGPSPKIYSDRVFIVHGHDAAPKLELARLLEQLSLKPVILHEQVDAGRTIFEKLREELSDIGFGFILLTPDDTAASVAAPVSTRPRARQNVVFEHGLLIGLLGPEMVCAIVKGDIEIPSDLQGVVYKHIPSSGGLNAIALEIAKELKAAGLKIDMNALVD